MSFGTTIVNIGLSKGTCALLEQKMNKEMLWLVWHHHILKILLQGVVIMSVGISNKPSILLALYY